MSSAIIRRIAAGLRLDGKGVVALEFGLTAGFFLTLVLGIVEMGLYLFTRQSLEVLTGLVARAAVVGTVTAGCPITIPGSIPIPPIISGPGLRVCVASGSGGSQTSYVVTGSYSYTFLLPVFAASSGTISQQVSPEY